MSDEQTPLPRPPRPDEDLERFHNGDTLDNLPVIQDRRKVPWRGVAFCGLLAAVLAISGSVLVLRTSPGGPPRAMPAATPSMLRALTHKTPQPSATAAAASAAPTGRPSATEQDCVPVHYKLAAGPARSVSQ